MYADQASATLSAFAITQKRSESPQEYYRRLRAAYFQGRNALGLEEETKETNIRVTPKSSVGQTRPLAFSKKEKSASRETPSKEVSIAKRSSNYSKGAIDLHEMEDFIRKCVIEAMKQQTPHQQPASPSPLAKDPDAKPRQHD